MPRVVKIEITEEAETLKKLLVQQKDKRRFERVQALYLLKIQQVETVEQLAMMSGRSRSTVQRWLSQYRSGGLAKMLEVGSSPGKEPLIPQWAVERLKAELSEPEGFTSYKEVKIWLEAVLDIKVKYDVVHHLVHDKLKAKLKVPRPVSVKQAEGAIEAFKKKLPQQLEALVKRVRQVYKSWQRLRYWCQDESRIGLHTMPGRLLTLKGVKPKGKVQWDFQALWLYGLVEPLTGESFFYEFCHLDTVCFEKFLELFAQAYPEDIHIIQLDNGGCHQALDLSLPENVILLFQPAHCPEVNPIERLWKEIKKILKWRIFSNLDELRKAICQVLQNLNQTIIASVTGWQFIIEALVSTEL
jgi:transposase